MMGKRKTGTAQSLKARVAASRERLYRVALAWCGDPMLADDLVQETLAAGIVKGDQLRDQDRLFQWLYSILNNQWRRHLRSARPQVEVDEDLPSTACGPSGNCEELEIVGRVRQAVQSLPSEQRQVIALVDLEEFSYCDVAEVLSIPIGTVMSRLHRGRKNLLARLEKTQDRPALVASNIRVVK